MPRKFLFVTTFNQKGLHDYAQRFINSFSKQVDKNIELWAYAERCNPIIPNKDTRIRVLDLERESTKLVEFKKKWKNVPHANGDISNFGKYAQRSDAKKGFKWNAVRFSHKVYSIFRAAEKTDADVLIWIDADTFVHNTWTYKQFSRLLPDDKWLTYVGRGKGSQTWPECGFYGMNLKHPMCKQFLAEFERFYEDANNGIFELEEWHDSFVFGHIINQMLPIDDNVLDYSADMYIKSAKTGGGGHPLINTELGTWIDHMKGARKDKGKSLDKDIIVKRKESYWNG